MSTAMRVVGVKEDKGGKAMAIAARMGKWTATATKRVMATATRVVGKQQQRQQRGQWQQQQGCWWLTKRATATVARAMATASRVAGKQQQQGQWQQRWQASNGDEGNAKGNSNNVGDGNSNEDCG
jgi:hypothetical protein